MLRSLVATTAIILSLVPAAGRAAEPSTGLLAALSRVPDSPAVREQLVSYVDYRAVEAARTGAARPTSFAELEALRAAEDPSARLWTAAYTGIASGSGDLLRSLYGSAGEWPTLLGFDFFDVDRELAFGEPPSDGLVLLGRFDPAAIARAFAARAYTATDVDERSLLCGPDGCDSGFQQHVEQRDPANPFGGELGRVQPLAVSASDLLSSASDETVRAMLDAASGAVPSLAADPAYRAAAEALATDAPLSQAMFVPGTLLEADLAAILLKGGDAARAELEKLAASFEPIPSYQLLAFSDGATATEQVVTVALVYNREEDAGRAVDVIPQRLDTMPSLRVLTPLRELLDEQGVGAVEGRVVASSDGTRAVAILTLRAPLASQVPDPDTDLLTPSSRVYRMLVGMVATRDTLWLAPSLPDEG